MITIVVQGGLGNQLFQYAFGRKLMKLGKAVVFDKSFFEDNIKYTKRNYFLDKFNLPDEIKILNKKNKQSFYVRLLNKIDTDRRVRFVENNLKKENGVFDGYYQSEKYFLDIKEILISEIKLKEKSKKYKEWESRILNSKDSLIIHARRTDFLGSGFVNLGKDYYIKALKNFPSDCEVFAFSDDINWLIEVLGERAIAVSGNGLESYEELSLMTLGNNFIISNSTFSWWGAWLSEYKDKKIIAPKKWFKSIFWWRADKDIVPNNWIRI